ncbi:hypothetical protein V3391_13310 [Luteimonas sp. SMYT11W]|uniref:Prolipoprotein diacylglyceryl transferase n=1 Tax=Luteimonas flava TaxID=3115822 RepID=A0ABU7WI46_9GAMM
MAFFGFLSLRIIYYFGQKLISGAGFAEADLIVLVFGLLLVFVTIAQIISLRPGRKPI